MNIQQKEEKTAIDVDIGDRKLIYVAHPFRGLIENEKKVERIILQLIKDYPNYTFFSPIHATGYYYHEKTWEEGMKDCLRLLSVCDALWLCEGWEDSKGCCSEMDYAMSHGIECAFV